MAPNQPASRAVKVQADHWAVSSNHVIQLARFVDPINHATAPPQHHHHPARRRLPRPAAMAAAQEPCLTEEERQVQKSYWIEHSLQPTVEAMMLDSKAAEIDQLERPEVCVCVCVGGLCAEGCGVLRSAAPPGCCCRYTPRSAAAHAQQHAPHPSSRARACRCARDAASAERAEPASAHCQRPRQLMFSEQHALNCP
jgi:hypothetical protein